MSKIPSLEETLDEVEKYWDTDRTEATRAIMKYATAEREAGARAEKKRIFQEYIVSRKETKEERNQSDAWNDLGNTLRNVV